MNSIRKGTLGLLAFVAVCAAAIAQDFKVKSVGSVRHGADTQVTVVFSKPVQEASGTAAANYSFGGGIAVTGASLMTGLPGPTLVDVAQNPAPFGRVYDNECVVLTVTGLAANANATVTIQNVQTSDGSQTIAPTTINFKDSGYSWVDIGVHPIPGKVIAINTSGFDIYSSGQTQWSDEDQTTFVYKEVTGDFQMTARGEFTDFSSRWGRAGIMAREVLNAGEAGTVQDTTASRYLDMHANPYKCFNDSDGTIAVANNQFETHYRAEVGGETASASGGTPQWPNAWFRMTRTGDSIVTDRSDDGDNWTQMADRIADTPTAWASKMYVGYSFSPEIGNINAANPPDAKNRLFLFQIRNGKIPVPRVSAFDPNPSGFRLTITDADSQAVPGSIKLTLNGTAITPSSVNKVGAVTTVLYSQADPFVKGSNNKLDIEFKDNNNITITASSSWTANYGLLAEDNRVASASNPGMTANVYQIDFVRTGGENTVAAAETQLARGFIVPGTSQPYPNVAAVSTADITVVNWDQFGIDIDTTPEDGPDHFNSVQPAEAPVPNDLIPGIPGSGFDPRAGNENGLGDNNITIEVITYLQLNKGSYRMGVNSDDGFRVSSAGGAPSVFGTVLGEFNGGRGAADTLFDFYAPAAGIYPFRMTWWEGSGGANAEWFTVDLATGERQLVNGAGATAVKAFRTANGRAYVKKLLPANGFAAVDRLASVSAEIANGTTAAVAGQTKLILDGVQVATGANNVSYTPSIPFEYNTVHTGSLIWTESTVPPTVHTDNFTFTVRTAGVADLPAGSFCIEAEMFDSNGLPAPGITGTAYSGEEYRGLTAKHDVDYHQDSNEPSQDGAYRAAIADGLTPNVPMDAQTTGAPDLDTVRAGFEVTTNFKIGWAANNEWYNYTRTIPAGIYNLFAAHSIDPAGNAGGTLSLVTSGVGTANQTLKTLATTSGTPPGGWGNNGLLPAPSAAGGFAAFKLPGGKVTLRYTTRAGDFDWFVLAPASGVPAQINSTTPANGDETAVRGVKVQATIEDFNATISASGIKLEFDGKDVTASTVVTKVNDITTVTYNVPEMQPATSHSYKLSTTDSANNKREATATFTTFPIAVPGMFNVEAEDYDYDNGKTVAAASTMPYAGGAYNGLAAVLGVDYQCDNGNDSDLYRPDTGPNNVNLNDNITGTHGRARGFWEVTVNYKHGWTGANQWFNYTRTVPAGTYNIYAAMSHGDPASNAHGIQGTIGKVTSGQGTPNQAVDALGIFDAPATGGWGANALVPMSDSVGGAPKIVSLSGPTTFRFESISGDFDYFLLVPALQAPAFTSIKRNTDGSITVEWTGGGVLEAATSLAPPVTWTTVATSSPFTFTPQAGVPTMFGRIKR